MIFSLDVRRARKGDCLLLHFGPRDTPGLALIDGGPATVYQAHLRPRLEQLRQARHLADNQPLPVDLLMVSHVDDDHIQGILDLTREMIEAKDAHRPQRLRIASFWHNSFDAVLGNPPKELTAALSGHFGAAAVGGALPSDATLDDDVDWPDGRPTDEEIHDTLKVLASIEQGHRLRTDAAKLGLELNPEFDGKLVMVGADPIDAGRGLTLTVVGPMLPELQALHEKHEAWLRDLKAKKKSPPAALAAFVDQSVPNLSSLVILAAAGSRRMLLTGDARGDKILEGLQQVGTLAPGADSVVHVDLLKVPHHGSANNLTRGFFERVTADHYVFSGNGEHGNPERESIEMLFAARAGQPFVIHLTYPVNDIDGERKKDWEKEQDKEKKRKAKNPSVTVRPDWSNAKHSLAAFFDQTPLAEGQTIEVIDDDVAPHVIDLLERV